MKTRITKLPSPTPFWLVLPLLFLCGMAQAVTKNSGLSLCPTNTLTCAVYGATTTLRCTIKNYYPGSLFQCHPGASTFHDVTTATPITDVWFPNTAWIGSPDTVCTNASPYCWQITFQTSGQSITLTPSTSTDFDNDGILNGTDNCPANANTNQSNNDGDSLGDVCDPDDDNDGVADTTDKFPLNPTETLDNDNDGIGNNADTDDDNDAVPDGDDNCPLDANTDQLNTDGDTQGNVCDTDDDNDGVADTTDKFPLDPTETVDTDNDGTGNNADIDDDNDAVLDGGDNCPLDTNANQLNTDGDTQGNVCDTDDDNDGASDATDKFPLNVAASLDPDNDGFADNWNMACDSICQTNSGLVLDNCPSSTNTSQSDFDGDGDGDACDGDGDNDSVMTPNDAFPYDPSRSAANTNILYTLNGDNALDYFGFSVSSAGDVNNDGYDDVIVGASQDSDSGLAQVFSGVDGEILYTFNGDSLLDDFGFSVSSAGDVNNDGYDDVIVGAYGDDNNGSGSGSARVLSGANGEILYTFNGDNADDRFGFSVGGAGDVNNDGYDDVIVGAYGDDNNGSGSGSARVLSGANGEILYAFNGDNADDRFGFSVSGAGDVNNDGYGDMMVGASQDDNNGSNSGSAQVFSGMNGAILYTFNGDSADNRFGNTVNEAGDVNGDGYGDVIVGAYQDDNNGSNSGSAQVFSGMNSTILYTFNGDSADDRFGFSVSGAGDVNNDGYDDVIVGAYGDDNNGSGSGSARVLSGANGEILYTFNGDNANDSFGYYVSDAGDVNGDGYGDVIVGAYGDDNNGSSSGSARVLSGKGLWTDTDGDGQNNAIDSDDDNDSVLDINDVTPILFIDTDLDGIFDSLDWDDDNDGVPDNIDVAPLNNANTSELTLPLDSVYKGGKLSGMLE